RREVSVNIPDIESVQQVQPEERSPPRVRQRTQGNDEQVPPPLPRDDFEVLRQDMLDLIAQSRIVREEMAELRAETRELRAENRALREEMVRGRPQAPPVPIVPEPQVQAELNPPIHAPRRAARQIRDDEGVSIHDFLKLQTPEFSGVKGEDPED